MTLLGNMLPMMTSSPFYFPLSLWVIFLKLVPFSEILSENWGK